MSKRVPSWLGFYSLVVVGAGVFTWRNLVALVQSRRPPAPAAVVIDWQRYVRAGEGVGARFPQVTIIEFIDYSCSACKRLAPYIEEVLRSHPNDVSLVIKQFPILGEASVAGARAAVCASRQGVLAAYHHLLMSQRYLRPDSLVPLAVRAGVTDTAKFNACTKGRSAASAVALDIADAKELGVIGTPTFLVNDEQFQGAQPTIETIVVRHLSSHTGS